MGAGRGGRSGGGGLWFVDRIADNRDQHTYTGIGGDVSYCIAWHGVEDTFHCNFGLAYL